MKGLYSTQLLFLVASENWAGKLFIHEKLNSICKYFRHKIVKNAGMNTYFNYDFITFKSVVPEGDGRFFMVSLTIKNLLGYRLQMYFFFKVMFYTTKAIHNNNPRSRHRISFYSLKILSCIYE